VLFVGTSLDAVAVAVEVVVPVRKKAIVACSRSAGGELLGGRRDLSEALAFCCVTWSSCWIARFICADPTSCSRQAAVISSTSSAVRLMSGTSLANMSPASRAAVTVLDESVLISAAAV